MEEDKKNLKSLYIKLETQKTRYNTYNYQSIIDDASVGFLIQSKNNYYKHICYSLLIKKYI